MQAKTYQISPNFAKSKGWPNSFTATHLKETEKAIYIYGHGELDPQGHCIMCGRTLTHPGSILIGIGPDCLRNWDKREQVKNEMTQTDIDRLKAKVRSMQVDDWIPKVVVKKIYDSDEQIEVPEDHPMINDKPKADDVPKKAIHVQFKESGKKGIKITFPKDGEFGENVTRIKTLPGRRFHKQANPPFWTCPLSIEAVESLQEWSFELDQELIDFLNNSQINANELPGTIQVEGLRGELRPFQRQGVEFLEQRNGKALIGDEMGLGKTIQAIAYLQLHPEKRPAIIVCPNPLKLNWLKEIHAWISAPDVQVLGGKDPSMPIVSDILIINYDVLNDWTDKLKDTRPQVVITDECHYYKNNQAKRTKAVKKLCKGVPHMIALSGTPIVNRPIEGFNALKVIDDTIVPSFWKFVQRYCGATHNGFGWDFTGATNTDELHEKLTNTVMIRRKKEDVLTDLPAKVYGTIPFEISNQKEYKRAKNDFIQYITETKGKKAADRANNAEVLTKIGTLKQVAVRGKMKQTKNWIHNFIESNGKLVIFAVHKKIIDGLMEEFGDKAVKIDGSVSGQKREETVEQFQNDESIRLFVGNIQAAGVGITLTAASNVAFLELPWTPGEVRQATDRVHRIGQQESVNVYYLIASGTIEEDMAELIDKKQKTLDKVLDGKETEDESLLTELIKQYQS